MATLTRNGRTIVVPDAAAGSYLDEGWAVIGQAAPPAPRKKATRRRKPKQPTPPVSEES